MDGIQMLTQQYRIFNDEGKTFAFDNRAKSGFARGEGVGCLVLKPLSQALKDNDKIRSVIVNTGTGQDGKTVGMSLSHYRPYMQVLDLTQLH